MFWFSFMEPFFSVCGNGHRVNILKERPFIQILTLSLAPWQIPENISSAYSSEICPWFFSVLCMSAACVSSVLSQLNVPKKKIWQGQLLITDYLKSNIEEAPENLFIWTLGVLTKSLGITLTDKFLERQYKECASHEQVT